MQRLHRLVRFPRSLAARLAGIALISGVVLTALATAAGFFDRDPLHFFGDFGPGRRPVAALFFSGDMGLRFGLGATVTQELAAHGVPVMGVNMPTLFGRQRTRAEVDAIIAGAVRAALTRAHAERVVLVGQSYGSDILATGAAALPADLRARVAGIVLVVPARTAYFRADPTNFAYQAAPDAQTADAMRPVDWTPVTCIYGAAERDSLCPLLHGPGVRAIALPGGHYLRNDSDRLIAVILAALHSVIPPKTRSQ